jgi:hypothetical protein
VIEGRATAEGTQRRFDPRTLSPFTQFQTSFEPVSWNHYISEQLNVTENSENANNSLKNEESVLFSESDVCRTLHPQLGQHIHRVERTGWTLSRIGFGAYRTGRTTTHRRALYVVFHSLILVHLLLSSFFIENVCYFYLHSLKLIV